MAETKPKAGDNPKPTETKVVATLNSRVRQDEHYDSRVDKTFTHNKAIELTAKEFETVRDHKTWQDGKRITTVVKSGAEPEDEDE